MLSGMLGKIFCWIKRGGSASEPNIVKSGDPNAVADVEGEEISFSAEAQALRRLPQRKWILHHAMRGGVGAELGVYRGHFSEVLAAELQPARLYLVDPWEKSGESFGLGSGGPHAEFGKTTASFAKNDAMQRIEKLKGMDIRVIEDHASNFFASLDEKLDWVYLNSSRQYLSTLAELRMASQSLKPGGVIIGDGWQTDPSARHHDVFRAVRDFCRTNPFELIDAGSGQQWCIRHSQN